MKALVLLGKPHTAYKRRRSLSHCPLGLLGILVNCWPLLEPTEQVAILPWLQEWTQNFMGNRMLLFLFCHLLCCTYIRAVITIIFLFPWTFPDSRGLQKIDVSLLVSFYIWCLLFSKDSISWGWEAALSFTFRTSHLILIFLSFSFGCALGRGILVPNQRLNPGAWPCKCRV